MKLMRPLEASSNDRMMVSTFIRAFVSMTPPTWKPERRITRT